MNAKAKIIVALIGLVGGIIIAIIPNYMPDCRSVQHWLVIHSINNVGVENEIGRYVRVVASVNGVNYTFPSRAVYAEIGQEMCSERFPLPIGNSSYQISFWAFVKGPGQSPVSLVIQQNTDDIKFSQIPTNPSISKLYLLLSNGATEPKPTLEIYYAVVND